jgi:hypothetical protein
MPSVELSNEQKGIRKEGLAHHHHLTFSCRVAL